MPFTMVKFMRGWLGHLADHGYEVHILCTDGPELAGFALSENVTAVHTVTMRRRITVLQDLTNVVRIVRLLRKEKIDLVHAGTPKAGLLAMLAGWLARTPRRVYTVRGLPLETASGLRRRLYWLSEWAAMRLAHQVIAVSPSLRRRISELALCPQERVNVIGAGSSNGVDLNRFQRLIDPGGAPLRGELGIPNAAVVVGYVGRLVKDKGVVELTNAWMQVREQLPQLHLIMVGPLLEDETPLSDEVMTVLRLDPRVHLVGYRKDPLPCYEAMNFLVLPSHREGFPNVILEAAALGVPAITTTATGCVDAVIDGITGLLFPTRDVGRLTEAIAALATDPTMRATMGRAAFERARTHFAREAIWDGLLAEYESMFSE